MKRLIIFSDCGDTIIDENTEVFDQDGIVVSADCIEDADEVMRELHRQGYQLTLVADGNTASFNNLLSQHNLNETFPIRTISDVVGTLKPDPAMFEAAMAALNLTEGDKSRVVMIGNNLARDIAGANNFGITSIWLNWHQSHKYHKVPQNESELPDYTIKHPKDLLHLINYLESLI